VKPAAEHRLAIGQVHYLFCSSGVAQENYKCMFSISLSAITSLGSSDTRLIKYSTSSSLYYYWSHPILDEDVANDAISNILCSRLVNQVLLISIHTFLIYVVCHGVLKINAKRAFSLQNLYRSRLKCYCISTICIHNTLTRPSRTIYQPINLSGFSFVIPTDSLLFRRILPNVDKTRAFQVLKP
jgi:hypothetical protein